MSCDAHTHTPARKKVMRTSYCTHLFYKCGPQTIFSMGMGMGMGLNDTAHGTSRELAEGLRPPREESAEGPIGRARLIPLISVLRFWISDGLTQAESKFKGWNSHVHREFPRKFESSNVSRGNVSRVIGRTPRDGRAAPKTAPPCQGPPHYRLYILI